jgi:hypothetical protein
MKYQKIQIINKLVCDTEISDHETKLQLFDALVQSDVDFQIEYTHNGFNCSHKKIRIVAVETPNIRIKAFSGNCIFEHIILIDSIILIKLVTEKNNIIVGKKMSDFDLLDLSIEE